MVHRWWKKWGVAALVSYVAQGVIWWLLWSWGYSAVIAAAMAFVASWIVLFLTPLVIYMVKKKYRDRQ